MRTILTLLVAPWLAAVALAQSPSTGGDSGEADVAPRYAVEVIIFAYRQDVAVGSERFLPDELEDDSLFGGAESDGIEELPEPVPMPPPNLGDSQRAFEFRPLPEDELTMTAMIDRFERLDVYQPLMHFGWSQTALPEGESRPIELRIFGNTAAGLDGSFTLYLSRFLHLVVDLSLEAPPGSGAGYEFDVPRSRDGDERRRYDRGPVVPPAIHYRILENRIVKNGDLRYFDHPKYGVVAKVTRLEDPADDPAESAALLGRRGE